MKGVCILVILMVSALSANMRAEIVAHDTITASEAFVELPISVLDLIDKSRRMDMLDYYAADSIAKIPNVMEGLSFLDKVTRDYVKANLTPVSTITVKVLPLKRGEVVMTAYTIGDKDQAYDTELRFYDSNYTELKTAKFIKPATLDDFFDYPDKESKKRVAKLVPFPTVRYEPDVNGTGMSAELTVGQFMSADDYASIKPLLKPRLHYKWTGSKFNLEK